MERQLKRSHRDDAGLEVRGYFPLSSPEKSSTSALLHVHHMSVGFAGGRVVREDVSA